MKLIPTMLSIGLLTTSLVAQEAKLVMINTSSGLPEGVDFSAQPMGYEFGVKLSFFVEGEGFIRVKKDSLEADGWKLGHFVSISKDSSQASFTISKKGDFLNKVDSVKVTGKLTMVTGSKIEKKSALVSTDSETAIGTYKAQLKLDGKNNWGKGVILKGNLDNIKTIHAKIDGKMVKNRGWSSSHNERTYTFEGLKNNTEIEIEYWADTSEKVITFTK